MTIREVQHNLARVLYDVESGEVVEILRRKRAVARLVPVESPPSVREPVDWEDHEVQMAAIWGGVAVEEVSNVLDDLRGRS